MILGNLLQMNSLNMLHASALFNLVAFVPLFLLAGYIDYKCHEVPGTLCLGLALLLAVHSVLNGGSSWSVIIVIVCLFFTFGPIEFTTFGQADFLIVAHFITGCTLTTTGMTLVVISGVVWLVCLFVFLFFYRDKEGKRWQPCNGMMVPALPAYSVSVLIMSVLRMFVTNTLFFSGY